jgi:2-polyprenyl-6-methoxyphenol hydroxylase-like FAD-dependent oxidoreductase
MNGLGSNTCIQDAFNLAWKIAYVMEGKASKSILKSYNAERQPVGQIIVTRCLSPPHAHTFKFCTR